MEVYIRRTCAESYNHTVVKAVETGVRVRKVALAGNMPESKRGECEVRNMLLATHAVRERPSCKLNNKDAKVKGTAKNRKHDRKRNATNAMVGVVSQLSALSDLIEAHRNATGRERKRLRGIIRGKYQTAGYKACPV